MRILRAELLKIRRRWATFGVVIVLIALMALIYFITGLSARGVGGRLAAMQLLTFPGSYDVIRELTFSLGSLLGITYAAAIAGADWNWGIFRLVVARGEGRGRYLIIKFIAVAITLFIGVLIAFAAGILLTFGAASLAGITPGDPFGVESRDEVIRSIAFGYPVLLQRAAIGFAVAVLVKSQVAGVVIGIVLYFGELILTSILLALRFANEVLPGSRPPDLGTQWFQFLPFNIGNDVLSWIAPAASPSDGGFPSLTAVPLTSGLVVVAVYLLGALGVTWLTAERSQVSS
ncbi:MAG: hypothetical protein ABIZ34_03720 [Candidatus Limnocylindrales bacterium]